MSRQPKTFAYCYASGLIRFGRRVPDGALEIARGPARRLRDFIEPLCRHGYRTRPVRGRPTKIEGSDHLLVPGVPETAGQGAKLDKLHAWLGWIGGHAPQGVTVHRVPS